MSQIISQTDESSLHQLGEDVLRLLCLRNFQELADRFGYALAYERDSAEAIKADFDACFSDCKELPMTFSPHTCSVTVKYFAPNSPNLFAVIECIAQLSGNASALLELIVTTKGQNNYACIESISPCA